MGTADAYPFKLSTPLRFAVAVSVVTVVFLARSCVRLVDRRRQLVPALEYGGDGDCLGCRDRSSAGGDGGRRAVRGGWSTEADASATHAAPRAVSASGHRFSRQSSPSCGARGALQKRTRAGPTKLAARESGNRMKDEFLGTISHELRTPLNAVLGWVHLLRTGKLDPPRRGHAASKRSNATRMLQAQLTTNLLDISKALTGRLRVECRPVSLTRL